MRLTCVLASTLPDALEGPRYITRSTGSTVRSALVLGALWDRFDSGRS